MRASGRTTRIVDEAIQTLFTNGEIKVVSRTELSKEDNLLDLSTTITDHYHTSEAAKEVFERILLRLRTEHPRSPLKICSKTMKINLIRYVMNLQFSPITSGLLKGQAYDPASETLCLKFWDGKIYSYSPVTVEKYKEFLAAPSKGKYFHANFKANSELKIKQVTKT